METVVPLAEAQHDVEALYRTDADRLWGALYAFTADAEIASDAVAEGYAQLLARGSKVRDPGAWVWRAAFRIAKGQLKSRSRGQLTSELSATSQSGVDRYADHDLLNAVARLPEGQRSAVVLFYYADLPIRDIAARLGTNAIAVRANLSRGRRRLRKLLGDDHG